MRGLTLRFQYFTCWPLALRTALNLRGIELTKVAQYSGVMYWVHAILIFSLRSSTDVGFISATRYFKVFQQFSMTFKSGELPGHFAKISKLLCRHQSFTIFELWQGAPSCWIIVHPVRGNQVGSFSWSIERYTAPVTVELAGASQIGPRPRDEIPPQTITEGQCRIVGSV